jgi:hypothetical protein
MLAFFAIQPTNTSASIGIPFGGRVVMAYYCPCSLNLMLYILTPYGFVLPLVYQPGVSILYAKYKPFIGSALLGTYIPGGVCLSFYYCVPYGFPIGTVFMMGTS